MKSPVCFVLVAFLASCSSPTSSGGGGGGSGNGGSGGGGSDTAHNYFRVKNGLRFEVTF